VAPSVIEAGPRIAKLDRQLGTPVLVKIETYKILSTSSTTTVPHLSTSHWSMASTTRAMMRLPASSIAFRAASRRPFATSSQSFLTRARPSSRVFPDKSKLQQTFRRTYADVAPAKKPRRFRFFRFLWRVTYLSAIAGTAYLAYGVYELRHPDDQFEPDPTKKNLVILGLYSDFLLYYCH
jgi:hypothetical protein